MAKSRSRRMVVRSVVTLLLVGVCILLASGFHPSPVPVSVGRVKRADLDIVVEESGRTWMRRRATVFAPVAGSMERVELVSGDDVTRSSLVTRIYPLPPALLDMRARGEAEARVALARAQFSRAHADVGRYESARKFALEETERVRLLREAGSLSERELERAEFSLRTAEDELVTAQSSERVAEQEVALVRSLLESAREPKTAVLAVSMPLEGRVLRVLRESEGPVQCGEALVEIGEPSSMEVIVDVLTSDGVRINEGAEATVERWGATDVLRARVRRKEATALTTRSALGIEEQRVRVHLALTDAPERWGVLGDGYRVEVRIRVERLEQVRVAPTSALFRDDEQWAAFVIEGHTVKKARFAVGASTPDWTEIKSGLDPNTQLVLYPSDQVKPGVEVSFDDPS